MKIVVEPLKSVLSLNSCQGMLKIENEIRFLKIRLLIEKGKKKQLFEFELRFEQTSPK